jgi:imidazolonepropionase-like amidohydrolase
MNPPSNPTLLALSLTLALFAGAAAAHDPALQVAPLPAVPSAPAATGAVAFIDATVVPMDRERLLPRHTVVVVDGTIVALGPSAEVQVPEGAQRIDAAGRYLLPAFADMHVHVEGESWMALLSPEAQAASRDLPFESLLFPFLANGVTTVQVMSATPELLTLREQVSAGEVLAPRMILARMIDAPKKAWPPPLATWVETASEASDATRQAKADGYDKMKVYSFLGKDTYDAIMSTAKDLQMDVIGHVPNALSVEYVIDAGQRMIAHTEEVAKHANGDYSAERIDYFAARIADGGVWMTPTLATTRAIIEVLDDPDDLTRWPESAYFRHPMQAGIWSFIAQNLYRPIPESHRARIRSDFEQFQRPLTKVFHDKGGQVMTGTDSLFPGLVPGFALHHELRELVAVGLTPYQALRSSTTIPHEYLREADSAGTVAVGKQTDLLLVDGNPLQDVAAASKIAGVLVRGRWLDKAEIEQRMQALAASFEAGAVAAR